MEVNKQKINNENINNNFFFLFKIYFSVAPKISHNRIQRAVPPEQLTEQSANCERFVVGDPEKRMLYSPLYDNNYPNNTDCVVVLEGKPIYYVICRRCFFFVKGLVPRSLKSAELSG